MSLEKSSSNKSNNNYVPKKPYHFFSLPSNILLEGEIYKIIDGLSKKYYFTLHEEVFLFYEVLHYFLSIYYKIQKNRINTKRISKAGFISILI